MVGKPVVIPSGTEYGAKGAAINAAVAAGLFKDYREATGAMIRERKRYEPDMKRNAFYSEVYELYKEIYESHMELWDKRAALIRR
jgi:sugar (pentulose or hexulose) kinase